MALQHQETYFDYYRRVYGDYLVEHRLFDGPTGPAIFVAQQPEGSFPDKATDSFDLQINIGKQINGTFDLGPGRREYKLPNKSFVFTPPGVDSEYDLYGAHRIMCMSLPTAYIQGAGDMLGIDPGELESLLALPNNDVVISQIIKDCWSECSGGAERGPLFADASLMLIAMRLLSLSVRGQTAPKKNAYALSDLYYDRICQYVDSNIDTCLRIQTLAKLVGMSEFTFSAAFKARTGLPPYQWVIERRIGRAEALLKHSKMSLAEIAYATGFSSQSHMSSLFSQRVSMTPSEFRKACQ